MTESELISIGEFARRAGLTASALRFYDDAGLLRPEQVDPSTGYRFYSEPQVARAVRLRQLRAIGMPLSVIDTFFAASAEEAARLIDDQVARVAAEASDIQHAAATIKASLEDDGRQALCTLPGPILAAAIDQVLATTVHDAAHPILGGVHIESCPDAIKLTATDRYRLTTRTLVPGHPVAATQAGTELSPTWAGTVAGDDLHAAASRLRRSAGVTLEAATRTLGLRMSDGTVTHCRLLQETFPDYRLLIRSLPPVTHRVTVDKLQIVKALEQQAPENVGVRISDGRLSLLLPGGSAIAGSATGPDLTLWFELTTLYPALSHAFGSDLMLDLRGADQPATIRSADDGDLTTLVMPRRDPRQPDAAQ